MLPDSHSIISKKTPKSKIIIEHYWSGLQDFKSDKILFKGYFKPHKSIRDFYQTKTEGPMDTGTRTTKMFAPNRDWRTVDTGSPVASDGSS